MTASHPPARWTRLLHRRLLLSLTLPAAIGLVLLALALTDLVADRAPASVLLWVVPGTVVGYAIGGMIRVAWDSEAGQLVQSGGGLLVLLAYLGARFGSGYLLSPRFTVLRLALYRQRGGVGGRRTAPGQGSRDARGHPASARRS